MHTFIDWANHYGYDPKDPAAVTDYEHYQTNASLLTAIFSEANK